MYMLLCLVVCLTLLASFFLPSHLSLHMYEVPVGQTKYKNYTILPTKVIFADPMYIHVALQLHVHVYTVNMNYMYIL